MNDVIEDLCAALRRHETALSVLRAPGHRAAPVELEKLEHKRECCEQWLRLIHAERALERSRDGGARPSVRLAPGLIASPAKTESADHGPARIATDRT